MTTNESEIRELLERRTDAQQSKDIDRLLSFYSPDIVYYDAVPPLRFTGTEEVRRNFLRWFDGYKGPITLETHDLTIVTSEDTAFANMLHLDSGERKGLAGPVPSIWVRETVCLRRSNDRWVITHEHISIPFDPISFVKSYLLGMLQHAGRRAGKLVRPARDRRSGRTPDAGASRPRPRRRRGRLRSLHDGTGPLGYGPETDWLPVGIELAAPGEHWVDVHPVAFDENGHGRQADLDGGFFDYPPEAFSRGVIADRTVPCLSEPQQRSFHSGYEPRPQDVHDLAQLDALSTP